MAQAREDSEKARTEIRQTFGVDAKIGFQLFNGSSGRRFIVRVQFTSPPPGTASEVKEQVTEIIKRNFREPVTAVSVAL